jgi:hypothetical protein
METARPSRCRPVGRAVVAGAHAWVVRPGVA